MTSNPHKLAIITWLAAYPLITVLIILLDPLIAGLPVPLRTLVLSVFMVPAMVYGVMPAITARLKRWLSEEERWFALRPGGCDG